MAAVAKLSHLPPLFTSSLGTLEVFVQRLTLCFQPKTFA